MIVERLLTYFRDQRTDTLVSEIAHYCEEIERAQNRVDTMRFVLAEREKKIARHKENKK